MASLPQLALSPQCRLGGRQHPSDIARSHIQWRALPSRRPHAFPSRLPILCTAADGTESGAGVSESQAESLRLVPLLAGAAGGAAVLINRIINGVAPVSDASRCSIVFVLFSEFIAHITCFLTIVTIACLALSFPETLTCMWPDLCTEVRALQHCPLIILQYHSCV